jgi:hypothetical protein
VSRDWTLRFQRQQKEQEGLLNREVVLLRIEGEEETRLVSSGGRSPNVFFVRRSESGDVKVSSVSPKVMSSESVGVDACVVLDVLKEQGGVDGLI